MILINTPRTLAQTLQFLIQLPIVMTQYESFFFGKLTYVLKEEDTKIIRGIPQIYNENRNIKQ
jgi:hypothetical protein